MEDKVCADEEEDEDDGDETTIATKNRLDYAANEIIPKR